MCLIFEISVEKKCRNVGELFSDHSEYFPHAEKLELLFIISLVSVAFVDKTIARNMIYNLFYQLVVNVRKYLPKKRKMQRSAKLISALRR